ncbi:MAG: peptidoglycan synthetase, partial [Bacteroidota bacterium]
AAKRLQLLAKKPSAIAYQDFAHAPSKVQATIEALKAQYPRRQLIAALELHTFSSLNKQFLQEYHQTMEAADRAYVFFSEHTLKMKKLPPITPQDIQNAFSHPNLKVLTNDHHLLQRALQRFKWEGKNLLLMSSGTFGGAKLKELAQSCFNKN